MGYTVGFAQGIHPQISIWSILACLIQQGILMSELIAPINVVFLLRKIFGAATKKHNQLTQIFSDHIFDKVFLHHGPRH